MASQAVLLRGAECGHEAAGPRHSPPRHAAVQEEKFSEGQKWNKMKHSLKNCAKLVHVTIYNVYKFFNLLCFVRYEAST